MEGSSETKKITHGFLLSLIAGILLLINGVFWFMMIHFVAIVYDEMPPIMMLNLPFSARALSSLAA